MSKSHFTFGIFGNAFQKKKSVAIAGIIESLNAHGAEIMIEEQYHDFLKKSGEGLSCIPERAFSAEDIPSMDYAVSVGGDGTFLKTAALIGHKEIPILGVNVGRLGFLAEILPTQVSQAIDAICHETHSMERLSVIQADIAEGTDRRSVFAINDIAILKRDQASMITIETWIGQKPLVTYRSDGLIVSTPTGSTAYNLSNGGPIMPPGCDTFCLTAVAPHSLNIRPIIIKDEAKIRIKVQSRSHNFLIAADGNSMSLEQTCEINIRKAPFHTFVVRLTDRDYFTTLREKLMWGADQRAVE